MPRSALAALMLGAITAGATLPAAAVTCYAVVDRNDNIVYRGTMSPIDLSDKGKAEREALRQRGQQLIAMEVDRCFGVEYPTGAAGSSTLTVDAIVAGIQPLRTSTGGYAAPPAGGTAAAPSAAPARAPSTPPARGSGMSSGGTRSSY